jgi:WD40 repeat protein
VAGVLVSRRTSHASASSVTPNATPNQPIASHRRPRRGRAGGAAGAPARGSPARTIPTWANDLTFAPGGDRILTIHREGHAEIWNLDDGQKVATLASHSGPLGGVAFSPNGIRIATTGADGTVRLWDANTSVQTLELHGHSELVWDAAFSNDGSMLATASTDGTVRVWALDLDDLIDIARRKLTRTLADDECRQYLHLAQCR